jgi:DNA-binding transcriptional MocR family regulator
MAMPKANKRDRSEPQEHFTKMIRTTMETEAWRALSTTAQALYPWLKLEWRGPSANNNGKIRLSVRQAAERLGVTRNTAAQAFHDLQAKGFIVVAEPARLGLEGSAKSPAYEVTELALPYGNKPDGRKLYRDWKPGHDYAVHKTMANNPVGTNGKTEPCHHIDDSNVIDMVTNRRGTSSKA